MRSMYRGKRVDNEEWIEGTYLFEKSVDCGTALCIAQGPIDANDYSEILGDYYEVIPETVGRYAFQLDRHCRPLWEGDIVKSWFSGREEYYKVTLAGGAFGLRWVHNNILNDVAFVNFTDSVEYEWVGNVYDNPELIKGFINEKNIGGAEVEG